MATESTPIATSRRLFVDTTPAGATRAYARVGTGVTTVTPSYNPTIKTVQYINMASSKSSRTAYSKQFGIAGERVVGDTFMDFLIGLAEKVGGDCETTLVSYNDWDTATDGVYPAKRYNIMISVTNDGTLAGGDTQAIEATVFVNSEATAGTFNPTTLVFTASAT